MQKNMLDLVREILQEDDRLVSEGGLLQNKIMELAFKQDKELLKLLLSEDRIKEHFFTDVDGTLVFDKDKFVRFVSNKEFLPGSYTTFKNKIGLTEDGEYLDSKKEVVLAWPYKDCVLEGEQVDPNEKRNEVFWNEILAPDEIDRLLDPKVLTNFKRINEEGEHSNPDLRPDDNFIIRGNNLLALHSLCRVYRGKIKLIYMDPPYNVGSEFHYNDKFNHSTWLTFMKNRLEVAKELLREDGAIFVQISQHELPYLNVLMNQIFGRNNFIQLITVKTASPAGYKTINPGPIDVSEYILFYTKDKPSFKFKRGYVPVDYDDNYNLVIENPNDSPEKWNLTPLREVVYRENNVKIESSVHKTNQNAKEKWGMHWKKIRRELMAEYALKHADKVVSIRDPHGPSGRLKEMLERSRKERDKIFVYKKSKNEKENTYVINGGALSFYSDKIQTVHGEKTPTELLTDLWVDISWAGIAKEGGIQLKKGKKPEALMKRIIELNTEKGDIVLDPFLGVGTTAAVAHKIDRRYIGIEQLDYGKNDPTLRLKRVIEGEQGGVSKEVDWEGGGSFIYFELMKWNQNYINKIEKAESGEELLEIWEYMKEKAFLSYKVSPKKFDENAEDFKSLSLKNQKKFLIECLDKNHLYVNLSEISDEEYNISKEDKRLNTLSYGG